MTPRLAARLLDSLAAAGEGFETIVVDNGTGAQELDRAANGLGDAWVLRLSDNLGFFRAVNLASRRAQGNALLLLNDDCVVDAG